MNKRFLTLAGVAAVLSVGTYVGLNIVKPYKHEEPKVADVTSPDQVFGASVANPETHAEGEAAAPAAAAAPAGDTAAAVQPADTAVQPAGSAAASPAPATETAAAPAASAGGGSVAPLVPAGPTGAAPAAPAANTETASADQTPAPAAEPAPAPEPAPAAEPAPAPEADVAPAPAEKPKKAAKNPAHAAYKAPKSASAKVWWPAENDSKLSLVYAGPASFKKAVVLMFNGAFFKDDSVKSNIKLTNKAGKAVAGAWEIGENNRRMLVFPVPAAGTYKVSISSGLTDNKGRKVGSKLNGPVVIH
jgi:hypothetical protein